ncbi:hypothetical protein LSH36_334g03002 [Paralvinella palmiformis]|uniref:Calpain catalytic domain-containing protein n=1 Tax=Paralvinella palmiformis TaxID=53620 RepID=A0AAD9JGH6_9ANNE|nr:hypothetical protein LSH36_334g03002 [Paralvinella palmiformis]
MMSFFISHKNTVKSELSTKTIGPFSHLYGISYEELKCECLGKGELFEDPDFPANDDSIGLLEDSNHYIWKRPMEICKDARFVTDGISRFDVKQGNLGDCWVAAALGAICDNQNLLERVVPMGQSLDENYAGIFHFFLWQYGDWIEVIIDDRLPTLNGKLAFIKSTDRTEFWSALLEKAYAKIHGCYGGMEGGNPVEAMEDMTGGLQEWFWIRDKDPSEIAAIIRKAIERSSLISCSIQILLLNGTTVTLVRLRNPWGNNKEWKLAWSDRSEEWSLVSPEERQRMKFIRSEDGEFWMSFEDFVACFHKVEICNMGPDCLSCESSENCGKHWEAIRFEGSWIKNVNAGGCINFFGE